MSFFSDIFAGQFRGWKSFLPDLNFRDFSHANKLFISENHALAPKFNFLYYVDIKLNPLMLPRSFTTNEQIKLNMLVKKCTLPSYDMQLDPRNSYNRHTYAYKRMKYGPVDIDFHDDNSNIVTSFWASYYAYMIQDSTVGEQRFVNDKNMKREQHSFGIDNTVYAKNGSEGLFSVNIYQMNRRKFVGMKLINPRIDSFKHDPVGSEGTHVMASTMRLVYEAVEYTSGSVKFGNPTGFATLKYDQEPSPLKLPGKSITGILGSGGLLDTGLGVFDDISNGNIGLGTILKAGSVVSAVQKGGLKTMLKSEAAGLVTGVLTGKNPLDSIAPSVTGVFAPSNKSVELSGPTAPGTSAQGAVPTERKVDTSQSATAPNTATVTLFGTPTNILSPANNAGGPGVRLS